MDAQEIHIEPPPAFKQTTTISAEAPGDRKPPPTRGVDSPRPPNPRRETRPGHAPPLRQQARARDTVSRRVREVSQRARPRLLRQAPHELHAPPHVRPQGRDHRPLRRVLAEAEEHMRSSASQQQKGSIFQVY